MTMTPSEWNDRALDERFKAIADRLELLMDALEAVDNERQGWASSLTATEDRLNKRIDERVADLAREMGHTAELCSNFFEEYKADRAERQQWEKTRATTRTTMTIGLIAASMTAMATIVAAIITHGFS